MKKLLFALLLCAALVPLACLADGPVLLVELPEGAQMIEDVAFEDGDFIQTYQLDGGGQVQLLRYASFDMTLAELADGDWNGHEPAQTLTLPEMQGAQAEAMRFTYAQEDENVDVTMALVRAESQTLIFQAVFPASADKEAVDGAVEAMLASLSLLTDEPAQEDVVG